MFKKVAVVVALWGALSAPPATATDILNVEIETASQYELHYWLPFGSLQDTVPGLAHVLEHLKFAYGGDFSLDSLKAIKGSVIGASTSYRSTQFDASVTGNHLAETLVTLSRIAGPLPVDEAELVREKQVVTQELIERKNANPDGPFYETFERKLLEGTPYAALPGGTLQEVAKVEREDVAAFNAAHYQSAEGFLVIAGPPLSTLSVTLIKGSFPNSHVATVSIDAQRHSVVRDESLGTAPVFLPPVPLTTITPSRFRLEDVSSHVNSTRMIYSKVISTDITWKKTLAAAIVRAVMNSRLHEGLSEVIAEDAGLVQDFRVSIDTALPGLLRLELTANLAEGIKPEQVVAAYDRWLTKIIIEGISAKTFNRVKSRFFLHDEWDNAEVRLRELSETTAEYGFAKASTIRAALGDLTSDDANDLLRTFAKGGRIGVAILLPREANP